MKRALKEYPDKRTIERLFEYKEGKLLNRLSRGRAKKGYEAGGVTLGGYHRIHIYYKAYFTHRLIWILHNGHLPNDTQIDHINEIKCDNHIENLRAVTPQENAFNQKKVKGYTWVERCGKWKAGIKVNNKNIHLGYFTNSEDAHQAYINAKAKHHIIPDRLTTTKKP